MRCQSFDLRQRQVKGLLLALLRGEVERWITVACRNRQPIRKQGDDFAEVSGPWCEHRLKLIESLLVGIVAPEAGRPLELSDDRIARAVLMMRRAKIAQAGVRLIVEPLDNGLSDARFCRCLARPRATHPSPRLAC